jgi:hypothetical protein
MSGIRIIARTSAGRAALLRHRADRLKEPYVRRMAFSQLYDESVERQEPYTILILHKNNRMAAALPFDSLKVPIIDVMTENGAVIDQDYVLEPVGENRG